MDFWKEKKILLTGGAGFLGSFVHENLLKRGVKEKNIIIPRSKNFDLKIWDNCISIMKDIDIVIHLAARVGGIGYNRKYPATLFYDNLLMGIQLMEAARLEKIKKFVAIGTVCAYPKFTSIPFKEKDIWDGYPEETNAPYGLAKKMLLVQTQAYRKQYDFNAIYLLPVNLYGPRDNFHLEYSHVIPALIRKIIEAKNKKYKKIEVWGTGQASREFLYVEDASVGILLATEHYNKPYPVNIGSGKEIKICDLVDLIKKLVGYSGEIYWNTLKPDGQPRRVLDTSRAEIEFGFKSTTSIETGLIKTIKWYKSKINIC